MSLPQRQPAPKPWFAKGLRFECTQCGNCCRNRGQYAFVYLTDRDIDAIAGFLKLTRRAFLRRHCTRDGDAVSLRMDRPACEFLTQDDRCAIYPVRPKQCATWPFWRENLEKAVWEEEVSKDCPGIGKGRRRSAAEVERIAREDEEWHGLA